MAGNNTSSLGNYANAEGRMMKGGFALGGGRRRTRRHRGSRRRHHRSRKSSSGKGFFGLFR